MNAEKRKIGIRDRIDQSTAEMLCRRLELEVLTTERNNLCIGPNSRKPSDPIALQACTVHHQPGLDFSCSILNHHPFLMTKHPRYPGIHLDFATHSLDPFSDSFCHLPIIDDPRVGNMNRLHPDHVGLDLFQPFRADSFAANVVGQTPLINSFQLRNLARIHCNNHLATTVKRDVFLLTEGFHREFSLTAIRRPQ